MSIDEMNFKQRDKFRLILEDMATEIIAQYNNKIVGAFEKLKTRFPHTNSKESNELITELQREIQEGITILHQNVDKFIKISSKYPEIQKEIRQSKLYHFLKNKKHRREIVEGLCAQLRKESEAYKTHIENSPSFIALQGLVQNVIVSNGFQEFEKLSKKFL